MDKKQRGGGSSKSSSERQGAQALAGHIKARNRLPARKIMTRQEAPQQNNQDVLSIIHEWDLNPQRIEMKNTIEQKIDQIKAPSLLTANKVRDYLNNLPGWQLTNDHKMIYREFIVHNFLAAIHLIDDIALIAEDEQHHPDIHLTQYRNLRVGLISHEVHGLSEKDFSVASKINTVALNQQSQGKKKETKKVVRAKQKKVIAPAVRKNDKNKKSVLVKEGVKKARKPVKKA